MSSVEKCCLCDQSLDFGLLSIPPGLSRLPRQSAGFTEYRITLLAELKEHYKLDKWRTQSDDYSGLMLLEMCAYFLDIVGFYTEQTTNASYLRTTIRSESINVLVNILGYLTSPALASRASVAAILYKNQGAAFSNFAGFRSNKSANILPQIFEAQTPEMLYYERDSWSIDGQSIRITEDNEASISDKLIDIILEPKSVGLTRGKIVLFLKKEQTHSPHPQGFTTLDTLGDEQNIFVGHKVSFFRINGGIQTIAAARRVLELNSFIGRDEKKYVKVNAGPYSRLMYDHNIKFSLLSPSSHASISSYNKYLFIEDDILLDNPRKINVIDDSEIAGMEATRIYLDSIYRNIRERDFMVIELENELRVVLVADKYEDMVVVKPEDKDPTVDSPQIPVTVIEIVPRLESNWRDSPTSLTIHFNMIDGGQLTMPAKTEITLQDFGTDGLPIEGPAEPFPDEVEPPSELILEDANGFGVLVGGTVEIEEDGSGVVKIDSGEADRVRLPSRGLRTPVKVYGNVIHASRGETVPVEVLGSGDASKAFQKFTLAKKPLTYFENPNDAERPISTLEVRVNGIKWREVRSFFGCRSDEQVYIVRQDIEGNSTITFGDGIIGARLPSGVRNVVARYRFGAGAAKPPPGSITQLVRPIDGLKRVRSPVPAWGGRDAETPEEIRRNAPASALLLGRAVSPQDFEVLARKYNGVINAHVEWAWDEKLRTKKDSQSYRATTACCISSIRVKCLDAGTFLTIQRPVGFTLRTRKVKYTCIACASSNGAFFTYTRAVLAAIRIFAGHDTFANGWETITVLASTNTTSNSSTSTLSSTSPAVVGIIAQVCTNSITRSDAIAVQSKFGCSGSPVFENIEELGLKSSAHLTSEFNRFNFVDLNPAHVYRIGTPGSQNEGTINSTAIRCCQTSTSNSVRSIRMSDGSSESNSLTFSDRRCTRTQRRNGKTSNVTIRLRVPVGFSTRILVIVTISSNIYVTIRIGVDVSVSFVVRAIPVAGYKCKDDNQKRHNKERLEKNLHLIFPLTSVSIAQSPKTSEQRKVVSKSAFVDFFPRRVSFQFDAEKVHQLMEVGQ